MMLVIYLPHPEYTPQLVVYLYPLLLVSKSLVSIDVHLQLHNTFSQILICYYIITCLSNLLRHIGGSRTGRYCIRLSFGMWFKNSLVAMEADIRT